MITGVQQYNSTNFTAKLPTKKAAEVIKKAKKPPVPKENWTVIDLGPLDKALEEFCGGVKNSPGKVLQNIKLAGKVLKEGFRANWKFYTGK